jgi:hypothetical protein
MAMEDRARDEARPESIHDEHLRRDMQRVNSRLRHFRGVAASVLNDAQKVWEEIREACRDPRSCEEILEGIDDPIDRMPACGWPEFREKLHLLGHYIHYTKRLCDGSMDDLAKGEKEV